VKLGPLNYKVNGKILYHRMYGALFFVGALINSVPAVRFVYFISRVVQ